ncbi:pyridoxal phosphate-dependent aminotransferase [Candidatus Woesearchaeota archaeon]|nr:pyridoxal phosphate-dependent aminotransferase [Candidatus Woesearchaeota archaeon]
MNLAERIKSLPSSPTLAMSAKVKQLRAQKIAVVDFGLGEPDFSTPDCASKAGIEAITAGFTRYTPSGGIKELREAIAEKFRKDACLAYDVSEIVVGCGAKHVLYSVFMALCNPNDEVIVPSPYWVSYPDQIQLAGAVPVFLPRCRDDNYQFSAEQLDKVTSERTVGIVLNTPCNPTGAVYNEKTLEAVAAWAVKHDVFVVFDEIYEKFVYGAKHTNIATLDSMRDRTIVVNGVSKTYAMTGWRIGYAAGQKHVISAVENLMSQTTSNPNSIAQKASIEALKKGDESVRNMVEVFSSRRGVVLAELQELSGFKCSHPLGAFYFFPDVSHYYGGEIRGRKINNSVDFANLLLDEAKVAVLPGCVFGDDNAIRLSYVTSVDNIKKGFKQIKEVLG